MSAFVHRRQFVSLAIDALLPVPPASKCTFKGAAIKRFEFLVTFSTPFLLTRTRVSWCSGSTVLLRPASSQKKACLPAFSQSVKCTCSRYYMQLSIALAGQFLLDGPSVSLYLPTMTIFYQFTTCFPDFPPDNDNNSSF